MPYRWLNDTGNAPAITGASSFSEGGPPLACLELHAHQSLSPRGFVGFVGATAILVAVPLLTVVGSPILWGLLPFVLAMLALLWWALTRSWADTDVTETLTIWTDRLELTHQRGRGPQQSWATNTYWARLHLHPRRGPHRDYLTLTGGEDGRELQLGAFLTETERRQLYTELSNVLRASAALR